MVDALCSGRSVRKDVLVRIQSWAQETFSLFEKVFLFLFYGIRKDVFRFVPGFWHEPPEITPEAFSLILLPQKNS